ncbi:hypothetical protein [Micromonospora sp. NPDC004704]
MTVQPPTPRPSRAVQYAVLFGYVAFLVAWLLGVSRLRDTGHGGPVYLAGVLVILAAQLLLLWLNGRDESVRAVTGFAPPTPGGPPVLTAPARAWWRTDRAWLLFAGLPTIQLWISHDDLDGNGWVTWFARIVTLTAVTGMVVAIAMVLLEIRRGADLELRRDGLFLPGPFGGTELPWAEVPSGRLKGRRHNNRLVLRVQRRDSTSLLRRRRATVWFDRYGVSPEFMAGAIRHYLDHPARRVAIGTHEEYARLHALLYRGPGLLG